MDCFHGNRLTGNQVTDLDRNNATARAILANALQVDIGEVDHHSAIGVTERWDSLAHLRLILGVEEHLNRSLTSEEMLAIESLADIEAILSSGA